MTTVTCHCLATKMADYQLFEGKTTFCNKMSN